jgi:molybdopterin synthase catalytic subunit
MRSTLLDPAAPPTKAVDLGARRSESVAPMTVVARLEPDALDPQKELAALTADARGAGAIVTFVGLARARSKHGAAVESLVLDHHSRLTQQSLDRIATECIARFEVTHVRVVHRCGAVGADEPIVFAGAASLHRRAAFEAADYLMDRLKTEAVFWKREVGQEGSTWIEPTEADHVDRERWD